MIIVFSVLSLITFVMGVGYDHLKRPAYIKHLSNSQALKAVKLCEDIISSGNDLS